MRIMTGGNTGPTSVKINGLVKLSLGAKVNVQLDLTASYGRSVKTEVPIYISKTTYDVAADGCISVAISSRPSKIGITHQPARYRLVPGRGCSTSWFATAASRPKS